MPVEAAGVLTELEGGGSSRLASRDGGAIRRRRQRRPRRGAAAVQRLFEACRDVFNDVAPGAVPPLAGIERVKSILDSITTADVGLTPNMSHFQRVNPHGTPEITQLQLYKCEAFSICIFCLPSRGVIPLHNHPGMTVFSKLLFGTMHVKSYDWAAQQDKPDVAFQGPRLAKNACAVLDVLVPPYDDGSGRHCQHYNVSSSAISVGGSVVLPDSDRYEWLEEIETPQDFYLIGSTYMGPRILDH